jgi:hypothetical protein
MLDDFLATPVSSKETVIRVMDGLVVMRWVVGRSRFAAPS